MTSFFSVISKLKLFCLVFSAAANDFTTNAMAAAAAAAVTGGGQSGSVGLNSSSGSTGSNPFAAYSCSLSPNSQSSSSSEIQVSSPNFHSHGHVSTTSTSPVMCGLLGQSGSVGRQSSASASAAAAVAAGVLGLAGLPSLTPGKTSLPFKLRHKAGNSGSGNGAIGIDVGGARDSAGHDSDASSDSSMPPLSSSVDSNAPGSLSRDGACSPDSVLKTENFALKSELQRLASEVTTLKNVLVYSSQMQAAQVLANAAASSASIKDHSESDGGSSTAERLHLFRQMSNEQHSPVHRHHFSDDLDGKTLLSNVIQFQKLNDIIV